MKIELGKLTDPYEAGNRDAVHCAVAVVICDVTVEAGEKLWFLDDHMSRVALKGKGSHHAIADPFLQKLVVPGTGFVAMILPGLAVNMCHRFELKDELAEQLHENWCASVPCDQ